MMTVNKSATQAKRPFARASATLSHIITCPARVTQAEARRTRTIRGASAAGYKATARFGRGHATLRTRTGRHDPHGRIG